MAVRTGRKSSAASPQPSAAPSDAGDGELNLTAILAALADPARLATVRVLADRDESPCFKVQLDAGLEISRSTFSHHQRVLREAGLISVTVRGPERLLSLRRAEVDSAFPGLLDAVLTARWAA